MFARLRTFVHDTVHQALRKPRRTGRTMLLALGWIGMFALSGTVHAAISFVAATTVIADAGSISLTSPATASAGDLMLAVISSRGGSTITPPTGWSAALSPQAQDGATLTVAVFYRVRAAGDGASFSFSLSSSNRVAASMLAFSGVDSAAPIAAALGTVAGASTSSITANGVTTPAANSMLVGVFAQSNGNHSMTPPSGMSEAADFATSAGPNGVTLSVTYATQAGAGASGSKTATSNGSARSIGALVALRPAAASTTASAFEAFDTSTAAGATSGPLRTRVAGAASSFDIVVLAANGSLHPGFTGTVALSWLDARNNSGVATASCRASWLNLGSAGTAAFSANARVSTNLAPPATATRVMRLMMTYTSAGVTTTACSGDAFAAIPATLSLAVSDQNSSSAGSTRALANTSVSGGVVHQAGRPFTVSATARDASGTVMSGYDGTPTLASAGCVLPSGCTAGALSYTPTSAVAGNYSNASVSYAEVGAITLQLSDPSYADIDAGDTTAASRLVNSATANAGRFVPDSLIATITPTPQLATANAACLAAGSGATFFGQGFGWASAPQVTLTARNAAGATTLYWSGALMKLNAASGTPTLATSGAGSATLASSFGALGLVDLGNGQARFTASSLDRFVLDLPAATVQPSLTPGFTWTLNVSDNSESGVSGNTSLAASVAQAALTFDAGGVFHSGRLALSPAHGDARVGLRLQMELQRYTSAGWVTMTEDRGCVTVQPRNLGVESPSGVFASSICAAPLAANVSTRGGRAWLPLPGTPNAAPGRLALRLAGAAASGNSCAGLNTTQALSPLNLPWLLGSNSGAGPLALASWGRANRDAVLRRETW